MVPEDHQKKVTVRTKSRMHHHTTPASSRLEEVPHRFNLLNESVWQDCLDSASADVSQRDFLFDAGDHDMRGSL